MAGKAAHVKPFRLDDHKVGSNKLSEVIVSKWQGGILANIKKEDKWLVFLATGTTPQWGLKRVADRGLVGDDKAATALQVDAMLEYVAQYAPGCLYRDITLRCKSLKDVWTIVRDWAGLKTEGGCFHQAYFQVKQSFNKNDPDASIVDFFFQLRNAKEDCLLRAAANGGKIKYKGVVPTTDEELSPTMESDVVSDWLETIGGPALLEHVFRVFSKDLETESLADLRQRIVDNFDNLKTEASQQAELAKANISRMQTYRPYPRNPQYRGPPQTPQYRGPPNPQYRGPPPFRSQGQQNFRFPRQPLQRFPSPAFPRPFDQQRGKTPAFPPCKLCLATNPQRAASHSIGNCNSLTQSERQQITRSTSIQSPLEDLEPLQEAFDDPLLEYYYPQEVEYEGDLNLYDEEAEYYEESQHTAFQSTPASVKCVRIKKVNIYESPILACTKEASTIYVVLDYGATCSLITLRKARELGLSIMKTFHTAVQVDGESTLKVVGEVHTQFYRGKIPLRFSALVVQDMPTDVLGGTNFHKENDVWARMMNDTIRIGDTCIVMATSPTVLKMDQMDTRRRLVATTKRVTIAPGDYMEFEAPPDIPPTEFVQIEPNLQQTTAFFRPRIVELHNGSFKIENETDEAISLKKNCQAVNLRRVYDGPISPESTTKFPSLSAKCDSQSDILKKIEFDNAKNLSPCQLNNLKKIAIQNIKVFCSDLPGYNNAFGTLYANIEFATRTRPIPPKLRAPAYTAHGQYLFNTKCSQMKEAGVLVNPFEHGISPRFVNNSWLVLKPSAAGKNWEDCTPDDVRVVVGFDMLNKFILDSPRKVMRSEQIYASLASWKVIGELDFRDCYWQIPFKDETEKDKYKLGHLCIRTAMGTLCYSRAPMGLLGMDAFQGELTDMLFGDLVVQGKVIKLADNVYFGADNIEDLTNLFDIILSRCAAADLRIKPNKVVLNIKKAEILGLQWNAGKLSPCLHKLDPLSNCSPPKTVKGLRGFLGGVRWHEVCLPGAELAKVSKPLDEQARNNRQSREEVKWNPDLLQAFRDVQNILKNPLSVTIPRPGDTPYIVSDGCTHLPAGGTKLFLQRPGVPGFLPSFSFGARLPESFKNWPPHDIEAYFLNKGIQKHAHYIKECGKPGVALIDSKATVQAKQRMDRGEFSTSRRLQDLLYNLSSKRMSVQQISAKLPSPLLKMIDFASRNPVECLDPQCPVCLEIKQDDTTFFGKVNAVHNINLLSPAAWRDVQLSCSDLRRAHSLLSTGKVPGRKEKKVNDVRRYLGTCSVNKAGLVVYLKEVPFQSKKLELLVIPRSHAFTLAKTFHIQNDHPNPTQMNKLFSRHYYILDQVKILKEVWESCDVPCQASRLIKQETMSFNTETVPEVVSSRFNADVIEESKQKILVVRENLTSYTTAAIIKDQTAQTLRQNISILLYQLRLGKKALVRVDGQSALASIATNQDLADEGILLETGHSKNVNKNAVAEKAIRELREQMVKLNPSGGPISPIILAKAVSNLNDVIRHTGRSARELFMARDSVSGEKLNISDQKIADLQFKKRRINCDSSARHSSRDAPAVELPQLNVGDSVFIKSDRSKSHARDKFIVLEVNSDTAMATLQKFPMKNFRRNPLSVQLQNIYRAPHNNPHQQNQTESLHESDYQDVPDQNDHLNPNQTKPPAQQERSLRIIQEYSSSSSDSEYSDDQDDDSTSESQYHSASEVSDDDVLPVPVPVPVPLPVPVPVPVLHPEPILQQFLPQHEPLPGPHPPENLLYHRLTLLQPMAKSANAPRKGDILAFKMTDGWVKVKLISNSGYKHVKYNSHYWNIMDLSTEEMFGSYLIQDQFWGVLRGEDKEVNLQTTQLMTPDGIVVHDPGNNNN